MAAPIVLPGSSSPEQLTPDKIALADGKLSWQFENAGRGPALFVRTELDPGANPQHGAIAATAVGDVRFLTFTGVNKEQQQQVQLLVDYRDLAGRPYSTSITLDLQNGVPYDVLPFERSVTHHGDAVYPQPGLRDVSPKRPQPLTARAREALRVLSSKP